MIFDGHAYCFPPMDGDGGFADQEDFRRHLQQAMAAHFQPVWRARDLAPGDADALIDFSNWPSLDALKPSDFHAASNGRFEWTSDGERYFKQYFPPSVTDMSYLSGQIGCRDGLRWRVQGVAAPHAHTWESATTSSRTVWPGTPTVCWAWLTRRSG